MTNDGILGVLSGCGRCMSGAALGGTVGSATGLVVQAALALALGAGSYDGIAAHYAPGVMERVSLNRGMPIVECMIASPRHTIGQWVIVEGVNTGRRLRCRVTDTSQPQDKTRHLDAGLFELGWANTMELCGSTRLRNDECRIRVSRAFVFTD